MTPAQSPATDMYKADRLVLTAFSIGIGGSLVFWPLLTSWFAIGMFAYWLIAVKKNFSFNDNRLRFVILFSSLYILAIIGTAYSANMDEALFKLQQQSALAMFPLVFGTVMIWNAETSHRIFISFAWFTLAGCLVCLANGLFYFFTLGSTGALTGYPMVILKDMSPFMLGLYCLLSVMYLMGAIHQDMFKGRKRTLYIILLLALSGFLFLLGNRNVLFSWVIVVTFYLFKYITSIKLRFTLFGLLLAALIGAAIFNPALHRQINDLTDFSDTNTIQLDSDKSLGRDWGGKALRFAIWKCSMDIIKDHGLIGVGTGDVQDSLQAAYERRQFYFASRYNTYNAHNQFLQSTIAYGFPGFVLFGACLLIPLVVYSRGWRSREIDQGKQVYFLFLVTFLIVCMTESTLEISKGIVFYSFFNSIFAFVPTLQPLKQSS